MQKRMVTAICLLTMIIIMSSFGLQLDPVEIPVQSGNTLYVCPAASSIWDPIGTGFSQFSRFFKILLMSCLIVLTFSWGWALYQNLLKDKFDGDKYKQPWGLTKLLIWGIVIIYMLMLTPNYFKSVHINGDPNDYVLCEYGEENAREVPANIVTY